MLKDNMLKNSTKLDKKIIFGISILLLSVGGLSIGDSFGQTNGIPELLSDVPVAETAQNSELLSDADAVPQNSQIEVASSSLESTIPSDNLIRESKQVYANTSVFEQDTFTITAFDETIIITKDSSEVKDDYTTWWGSTEDGYNANFLIFDDGTIQASIFTAEKSYAIGWTGTDTIHTLKDLDLSQLPPEHGVDFDPTADEMDTSDFLQLPSAIQDDIELFANSHIGGHDYRENTLTITLVVGYTSAVESQPNGNNIERTIRGAVEDANRTYRDNRLPIVLDLVDNDLVRGYVESTGATAITSNLTLDRNNLRGDNGDTSLNGLRGQGLRDNADVVILVTHYPDVTSPGLKAPGCGQAGTIFADNIANSIAIVRDICLESNLSLPHEIGHLQGARHNPEAESPHVHSATNPFAYGHGYFDTTERQRTVMSYDCNIDNDQTTTDCRRMGVWSDPNDNFFGSVAPTGTENTNFNAKVLYGSAQHIASLRGDEQRFDNQSPTGFFNWVDLQISRIFNQGDTMDISATFDEPIHADHPPTVTISDGTLITPIVMNRDSDTAFSASHTLTTEEGTVTLQFSNAQDLFTNPITLIASGNTGSVTVNPPDTEKPVIALTGITPPLELRVDTYTELGATVTDNDPAYSENVVIGGDTVDTTTTGSYNVTYDAPADAAQNTPDQVTRVVTVQDTTVPVITLNNPEQNPQIIELGADYTELGATTDDGSLVTIDDTAFVNAVGSYDILYDSVDSSGNVANTVTRTVNVIDIPITTDGTIESYNKITMNSMGTDDGNAIGFGAGDMFGYKSANVGDIDGNGAEDFATVAHGADDNTSTIYLVLMNSDSTVKESHELSNCGNTAVKGIGESIEYLGEINGKPTIVFDSYWGYSEINVLSIDTSDYTHTCSKLSTGLAAYPTGVGWPITNVGTFEVDGNNDSIPDLIVGIDREAHGGTDLYVMDLDLDADGNITSTQRLIDASTILDWDGRYFDNSIIADIDGDDNTIDIVLGEPLDYQGNVIGFNGYMHIAFIDKTLFEINTVTTIEFANLGLDIDEDGNSRFGVGLANMGDLDGDDIDDIAVGIEGVDIGNDDSGAVAIMFLNPDGTIKEMSLISNDNTPYTLANGDLFGKGLAAIDTNGDGFPELVASAHSDDTGGIDAGAVYVLTFNQDTQLNGLSYDMAPTSVVLNPTFDNYYTQIFSTFVNYAYAVEPIPVFGSNILPFTSTITQVDDVLTVQTIDFSKNTINPKIIPVTTDGTIASYQKITSQTIGTSDGTTIGFGAGDLFGYKTTDVGDVDGNGVDDMVVVSFHANSRTGNTHLVLLNSDSTVKESYELSNCGNTTDIGIGESIDYLGEIDGKPTILFDNYYGNGEINVLSIDPTDYSHTCSKIDTTGLSSPGWPLVNAGLIDLNDNNDYIPDVIIGADNASYSGTALYIIDLEYENFQITTASTQLIDTSAISADMNWDNRYFENIVIAEIDGDSNTIDLVIGEPRQWRGATDFKGEVIVAFVDKTTYAITSTSTITPVILDGNSLTPYSSHFGIGLATVGDLNGDTIDDIVIGMEGNNDDGWSSGSVYVLFMDNDGTAKSHQKISNLYGNLSPDNTGGVLGNGDLFGKGLGAVIDIDGDGFVELIVSSHADDTGGKKAGAIYILSFNQT